MTEVLGSSLLLGLAWFAAVNLAATAACCAVAAWGGARRVTSGVWPLILRLIPACSALLMLALFLPSHWRFEPTAVAATDESFGWLLHLAAAAGAAMLLRAAVRAASVARAGWRLRHCDRLPRLSGDDAVFEVRDLDGVSLVGVLRTRILVGRRVREALTAAELEVALAHERAHRMSNDNLKRWAVYCAPDVFGLTRAGRELESRWHALAEFYADERAAAGSSRRALDLAAALVKVSRLSIAPPAWALSPTWSSLHDADLLEMRVRRLVGGSFAIPSRPWRLGPALAVAMTVVAALASNVWIAGALHVVTEAVIARLP